MSYYEDLGIYDVLDDDPHPMAYYEEYMKVYTRMLQLCRKYKMPSMEKQIEKQNKIITKNLTSLGENAQTFMFVAEKRSMDTSEDSPMIKKRRVKS